MRNCVEITYAFRKLSKNPITEIVLQNFNEQYFNKSYVTNNRCEIFEAGENVAIKGGGCRLH